MVSAVKFCDLLLVAVVIIFVQFYPLSYFDLGKEYCGQLVLLCSFVVVLMGPYYVTNTDGNRGRAFILLPPKAAVLPESDTGSDCV